MRADPPHARSQPPALPLLPLNAQVRGEDDEYEERLAANLVPNRDEAPDDGQSLMLVYFDSVICIYAVEGAPSFQARARARLATMRSAGDQPAISDLTCLECRVKPIRLGDCFGPADMEAFLTGSDVVRMPMPTAGTSELARIRAIHNYKLADALHQAAAVEGSCGLFLTNDHRLSGFPDIPIEVLP
jgi:predicted nucleic acid-binding protein